MKKPGLPPQTIPRAALVPAFILLAGMLWGQSPAPSDPESPAHLVGLTLNEVIGRFGVPRGVFTVRGGEEWQDDVVFSYGDRDFYFYRDRVWQIAVKTAFGVRVGENRNVIPLVMGDSTVVEEGYTLASLAGWSWPMNVRFNTDNRGLVTAIYIYRSDF
ncbi:MAG: hypothetical protein LBI91_00600 [Spirochaetaceae bacterium]|jgi:hypothetical protein|nr:hypothetical protein [Spirochaetaceae bacterium]